MAKSLNLCQFIGNLGQDPEIKYTKEGSAVATISIGVSDDYKDKSGKKVEQTNWIRVVAFGRPAEIIGEYTRKGSKIYISGKQVTRKWQDQSGADRYSTEIIANELQLLDSKETQAQSSAQRQVSPKPQNAAPGQYALDPFDEGPPF